MRPLINEQMVREGGIYAPPHHLFVYTKQGKSNLLNVLISIKHVIILITCDEIFLKKFGKFFQGLIIGKVYGSIAVDGPVNI